MLPHCHRGSSTLREWMHALAECIEHIPRVVCVPSPMTCTLVVTCVTPLNLVDRQTDQSRVANRSPRGDAQCLVRRLPPSQPIQGAEANQICLLETQIFFPNSTRFRNNSKEQGAPTGYRLQKFTLFGKGRRSVLVQHFPLRGRVRLLL